jgi:hypothetical protein
MRLMIAITMVLSGLALAGCERGERQGVLGSGISKTESRDVDPFHELELVGSAQIDVTTGPLEPVALTADDNLLPLISTAVLDGRLIIRPTQPLRPRTGLRAKVVVPQLDRVICRGAGRIAASGLKNEALRAEIHGAATVTAQGETAKFSIVTKGAGVVQAEELIADHVDVSVTGTGSASVHASETLTVSITGAGRVRYAGEPEVTQQIVGLGSVSRKP